MRSLFVVATLVAVWAAAPAAWAGVQPAPSRSVPADTLRYTVASGEALLVTLPTTYRGSEASYRLIEGPALSWLVDRSFLWQSRRGDRGVFFATLEVRGAGRAPESLVLRIDVEGG